MIRKTIRMSVEELPETTVQAVWNSIDLDGNGWIDAGEFGRFFRLGEKPLANTRKKQRDELAQLRKPIPRHAGVVVAAHGPHTAGPVELGPAVHGARGQPA